MKSLLLMMIIFFPVTVFGQGVFGTGWILESEYTSKYIILFEKDGTFTYLNISYPDLLEGMVDVENDDNHIYSVEDGNRITISFNGGFMTCSLEISSSKDEMSGRCVNQTSIQNKSGTWVTNGKKIK
tara:strand:+ start:180 stop:560 length:381 start_codon:yes stop_codon:yes gene_type:complete